MTMTTGAEPNTAVGRLLRERLYAHFMEGLSDREYDDITKIVLAWQNTLALPPSTPASATDNVAAFYEGWSSRQRAERLRRALLDLAGLDYAYDARLDSGDYGGLERAHEFAERLSDRLAQDHSPEPER